MALFRRTSRHPGTAAVREAFRRVTAVLDAAQHTLLSAVPTARNPGLSLPTALDEFLARLTRAEAAMPAWRTAGTETLWLRCERALSRSHVEAQTLRNHAARERMDFETLNARLGDIVAPLEEFADAASEIRRLR